MIKNIVFDFGGVLLDLDASRTFAELADVTGVDMELDEVPAQIFKVMLGYEKGEINTETFLWNLQKESKKLTPQPDKLIKAWNAMLLGWNEERFQFLKDLRETYHVYLLSNTNELHIDWVRRDLKKNHKIKIFEEQFFDKVYYSHNLKLRKPEEEIYQHVTEDANLKKEETLFIDDNPENVAAARAHGWHAVVHNPADEIMTMVKSYIAKVV